MSNGKPTNTRLYMVFATLVLLLLLVVFPAVSWLYLDKGLAWRKQAQSELRDYGKTPGTMSVFSDTASLLQMKGKVSLIHLYAPGAELQGLLDNGKQLCNQFGADPNDKKSANVFRYILMPADSVATPPDPGKVEKPKNWVFAKAQDDWEASLQQAYAAYCSETNTTPAPQYYALVAPDGVIKRFYDLNDKAQMSRMVEHTALLMPIK